MSSHRRRPKSCWPNRLSDRELGIDPVSGNMIIAVWPLRPVRHRVAARGRTCGAEADPDAKPKKAAKSKIKPRTAASSKDMSLDTVNLDDALALLSIPPAVGQHPEDNEGCRCPQWSLRPLRDVEQGIAFAS